MCLSVLILPKRNPEIAQKVTVFSSRKIQVPLALFGSIMLGGFLIVHIWKDLSTTLDAWYFHSTPIWIIVMGVATVIYIREFRKLQHKGVNLKELFYKLPPE